MIFRMFLVMLVSNALTIQGVASNRPEKKTYASDPCHGKKKGSMKINSNVTDGQSLCNSLRNKRGRTPWELRYLNILKRDVDAVYQSFSSMELCTEGMQAEKDQNKRDKRLDRVFPKFYRKSRRSLSRKLSWKCRAYIQLTQIQELLRVNLANHSNNTVLNPTDRLSQTRLLNDNHTVRFKQYRCRLLKEINCLKKSASQRCMNITHVLLNETPIQLRNALVETETDCRTVKVISSILKDALTSGNRIHQRMIHNATRREKMEDRHVKSENVSMEHIDVISIRLLKSEAYNISKTYKIQLARVGEKHGSCNENNATRQQRKKSEMDRGRRLVNLTRRDWSGGEESKLLCTLYMELNEAASILRQVIKLNKNRLIHSPNNITIIYPSLGEFTTGLNTVRFNISTQMQQSLSDFKRCDKIASKLIEFKWTESKLSRSSNSIEVRTCWRLQEIQRHLKSAVELTRPADLSISRHKS